MSHSAMAARLGASASTRHVSTFDSNSASATPGSQLHSTGAQYLIDAQVGGTSKFSVTSAGAVTAASDFIGASTSCIYLGATGTDGSWRWCRSGNNSVMERRESGSWVTKQTITP